MWKIDFILQNGELVVLLYISFCSIPKLITLFMQNFRRIWLKENNTLWHYLCSLFSYLLIKINFEIECNIISDTELASKNPCKIVKKLIGSLKANFSIEQWDGYNISDGKLLCFGMTSAKSSLRYFYSYLQSTVLFFYYLIDLSTNERQRKKQSKFSPWSKVQLE